MAVSLPQLLAQRTATRDRLKDLQKRAEAADPAAGIMAPELQAEFDTAAATLAGLDRAISNRAAVDALERVETGTTLAGGDNKLELALRAFRPNVAIAGCAGLRIDDGPEREVSAELARRSGRKVEGMLMPWQCFHRPYRAARVDTSRAGLRHHRHLSGRDAVCRRTAGRDCVRPPRRALHHRLAAAD